MASWFLTFNSDPRTFEEAPFKVKKGNDFILDYPDLTLWNRTYLEQNDRLNSALNVNDQGRVLKRGLAIFGVMDPRMTIYEMQNIETSVNIRWLERTRDIEVTEYKTLMNVYERFARDFDARFVVGHEPKKTGRKWRQLEF